MKYSRECREKNTSMLRILLQHCNVIIAKKVQIFFKYVRAIVRYLEEFATLTSLPKAGKAFITARLSAKAPITGDPIEAHAILFSFLVVSIVFRSPFTPFGWETT